MHLHVNIFQDSDLDPPSTRHGDTYSYNFLLTYAPKRPYAYYVTHVAFNGI